jgi:spermidine synthase
VTVPSRSGRSARAAAGAPAARTRLPPGQRAVAPQVTISEVDGVRYLHFGSIWVQGAMRIARPFALEIEYQQQMMAPALFVPRPGHIVQLGLGAAALAKFCWRYLPQADVSVVEISEAVMAAARRWFKLPPEDERLTLIPGDALAVISDPRRVAFDGRRADWLQVDLYDADAAGPVYDDEAFYAACRRLLAPHGVAAINLFGRSFEPSRRAIDAAFDGQWRVLPEADAGNRIVLAFGRKVPDIPYSSLYSRAVTMEQQWRLPARKWVSALRSATRERA